MLGRELCVCGGSPDGHIALSGRRLGARRLAERRREYRPASMSFGVAIVLLGGVQAAVVALPGAGWPPIGWRPSGRGWALIAPGSIAVVVAAIAAVPGIADGLTWVALIFVPLLAAAALGWAMRGARPAWALAAAVLFLVAYADEGSLVGDIAALSLTALSCVTLGRLLAALAPTLLIKAGLILTSMVDTTLIVAHQLQGPNAVLNAAAPGAHLPQLQFAALGPAQMGYGDLFVAALLGAALAAEGRATWPAAVATLVFASLMDLLFLVTDELPATVPVAAALIIVELWPRWRRRVHGSFTTTSQPGNRWRRGSPGS
jgi:hypothetical protein